METDNVTEIGDMLGTGIPWSTFESLQTLEDGKVRERNGSNPLVYWVWDGSIYTDIWKYILLSTFLNSLLVVCKTSNKEKGRIPSTSGDTRNFLSAHSYTHECAKSNVRKKLRQCGKSLRIQWMLISVPSEILIPRNLTDPVAERSTIISKVLSGLSLKMFWLPQRTCSSQDLEFNITVLRGAVTFVEREKQWGQDRTPGGNSADSPVVVSWWFTDKWKEMPSWFYEKNGNEA